MTDTPDGQRVDIWLWRARLLKTRSLATRIVQNGQVRLSQAGQTRRLTKASALVRAGDRLTLVLNKQIVRLEILGLGDRRGPANEARELYTVLDDAADGTGSDTD
ncbi:S4 domain-containing protein [Maricaulis parjimensis]|uniref:S4 domain-containing protein n=1 Tax=Maricaulis parjimensis TaxID=144023 RepID=UPI0019394793